MTNTTKTYTLELTHYFTGAYTEITANSPEECFKIAKEKGYSMGLWEYFITY